jgi:hypothetical protein
MRRLAEALGVDYDQWRALTRAMARMDFRTTRVQGSTVQMNTDDRQAGRMVGQSILYLFMGVAATILVAVVDDVMLTGTIVLTYVMAMVALMVLVDHQSVITSPDDYLVLGARPVSSKTYFAVRLSNVLMYVLALTTAFGVLPMIAFGVARGFRPWLWLAAVLAFYLASTFTALTMVYSYASMLRFIGVGRLTRLVSYLQLVIGVLVYGAYLLPGEFSRLSEAGLTMPHTPWLLLFPPTWFASYLSIADGAFGLRQWLPALASMAALLLVARGLGGRLSLDYADRLGAIVSAAAPAAAARAGRRRPWLFRRGDSRVVALLIRAQFRNDQKFRMAIFGVLPMTIVYMYLSFRDGVPPDPLTGRLTVDGWGMISLAVLFFPMMVRMSLVRSDAWRASWIYFGTPVSRARILRAQTYIVITYFLAPYLVAVSLVMGWFIGRLAGVALHVMFLGAMSLLMLQVVTVIAPELPFSQPPQKLSKNGAMTFWLIVMSIFGIGMSPLFGRFVYISPGRTAVAAALFIILSLGLDRLTRVRIGEQAEQLEFEA